MKTISRGSLVSFVYDNNPQSRYVDVTNVKGAGFEGVDYSRQTDTDTGYRSFKFDKLNIDSVRIVATDKECVLPNTITAVTTILEHLGLTDRIRYDKAEDVFVVPKDLIKNDHPF